jgi:hypothetical protein
MGVKMLSTKEKQAPVRHIADVLTRGIHEGLFPAHLELVPQLSEVYELELAFDESQILSDEDIKLRLFGTCDNLSN